MAPRESSLVRPGLVDSAVQRYRVDREYPPRVRPHPRAHCGGVGTGCKAPSESPCIRGVSVSGPPTKRLTKTQRRDLSLLRCPPCEECQGRDMLVIERCPICGAKDRVICNR